MLKLRLNRIHHLNRLYSTQPIPPVNRKGIIRRLVLPTTFFAGLFYGAGVYGSSQNDKFRDFFMDQVPLGETVLNICEESNLEQLADLSKGTIEVVDQSIQKIKSIAGVTDTSSTTTHEKPIVEKIKAKTEAAVQRGKELSQQKLPEVIPKKIQPPPISVVQEAPISVKPASSNLPTYDREIPIGHEPPPGYIGSAPRPRDPSTGPIPPPPTLPLLAPTVKELASSEPILAQLASSIDSLAGFLRDHPNVIVRGKDPSGLDPPKVLSTASEDLKNLADRLQNLKEEKKLELQSKLDLQAKEYGKILLEAEKELHQRLDQQEENWKNEFDSERVKLSEKFQQKLNKELEVQESLINERLEQEVIKQGIEIQRNWINKIKSEIELERDGRYSKLSKLESCFKQLGRLTLDNQDSLDHQLRINSLWNSIRSINSNVFDTQSFTKIPLDNHIRALKRISANSHKINSTIDEDDQSVDLLSTAIDTIPENVVESGIESLPNLTLWYKQSVYPRIQSASLIPKQGGLISYLTSYLLSNLFFTNLHASSSPFETKDPIHILNQVDKFLDIKDLNSAIRTLNLLDGWPKVLAHDWIVEARKHLEFQQAIQVIETEATLQSLLS
ncbi:hypothetical protein MJO28_014996 [Puccinia striiformis f. sp. tritici]|uniref:Uncharacterized protein n=1 Tax=Puccinia striiformis f. sp. tritici TaxID=168172 RepID=A0ACC0DSG1_9BASI|nr:hypothetical protein MJO28_014996 [Puccinia striiformis f. sp. tritici]